MYVLSTCRLTPQAFCEKFSNKANKPTYTEEDVPDLSGKVHLVTGANTGLSKEFAQILFSGNATVWVATKRKPQCDSIYP